MATSVPPGPIAGPSCSPMTLRWGRTSNDVPWVLNRDTQPSQTTTPPPDGGYAGSDYFGHSASLNVASNGTTLDNISVANTHLTCSVNTDNVSGSNDVAIVSGDHRRLRSIQRVQQHLCGCDFGGRHDQRGIPRVRRESRLRRS